MQQCSIPRRFLVPWLLSGANYHVTRVSLLALFDQRWFLALILAPFVHDSCSCFVVTMSLSCTFRDIAILQHTLILVTLRSPSARIELTWLTYFDWVVHMYPSGNGPAYSGPIRWGLFITGSLRYGWSMYLTSFVFQWNGKWNIERPFSRSIYTNFWTVLVQFSSICVMWMNFTEPLILPFHGGWKAELA